jgi:deoxyribodipyrimidine photolyase-related protein
MSKAVNRGLITPDVVLRKVRAWYIRQQHQTPDMVASYEGFIRQLAWREYCRLYYESISSLRVKKNFFGMPKHKLGKEWYHANTGMGVIDDAIRDAWTMGYLHHIRRLMVVANYMTLSEIHPDAMYQWFMEFALDSYPWVMVFNVYGMGSYSDGGIGSYKPYISSSAYLQKMGVHMTKEERVNWDGLYHKFMQKHANKLRHTPIWKISKKMT